VAPAGEVVEFGSPQELLDGGGRGLLAGLVADTGPRQAALLHRIARGEAAVTESASGVDLTSLAN